VLSLQLKVTAQHHGELGFQRLDAQSLAGFGGLQHSVRRLQALELAGRCRQLRGAAFGVLLRPQGGKAVRLAQLGMLPRQLLQPAAGVLCGCCSSVALSA
jgi:hypothetical protein